MPRDELRRQAKWDLNEENSKDGAAFNVRISESIRKKSRLGLARRQRRWTAASIKIWGWRAIGTLRPTISAHSRLVPLEFGLLIVIQQGRDARNFILVDGSRSFKAVFRRERLILKHCIKSLLHIGQDGAYQALLRVCELIAFRHSCELLVDIHRRRCICAVRWRPHLVWRGRARVLRRYVLRPGKENGERHPENGDSGACF